MPFMEIRHVKGMNAPRKKNKPIRCVFGLFSSSTISVDNPGDNGFVLREMVHTE